MAEVASREGLIQVMRDMLAAPEEFDWLATGLEIARKLRNDPRSTVAGRSAPRNWPAATQARYAGKRRRTGCARTCPVTCCSATWNSCWTG